MRGLREWVCRGDRLAVAWPIHGVGTTAVYLGSGRQSRRAGASLRARLLGPAPEPEGNLDMGLMLVVGGCCVWCSGGCGGVRGVCFLGWGGVGMGCTFDLGLIVVVFGNGAVVLHMVVVVLRLWWSCCVYGGGGRWSPAMCS